MPDSMGKRQRRDVKAKKAAAIEERRLARAQRRADREAGLDRGERHVDDQRVQKDHEQAKPGGDESDALRAVHEPEHRKRTTRNSTCTRCLPRRQRQ